ARAQKKELEAQRKADTANRITDALQQMLFAINPDPAKGLHYTARQLIDDYADNMDAKLSNDPEAAAQLHMTIGTAYACLEEPEKSKKHLKRALELRRQLYGETH